MYGTVYIYRSVFVFLSLDGEEWSPSLLTWVGPKPVCIMWRREKNHLPRSGIEEIPCPSSIHPAILRIELSTLHLHHSNNLDLPISFTKLQCLFLWGLWGGVCFIWCFFFFFLQLGPSGLCPPPPPPPQASYSVDSESPLPYSRRAGMWN
jgi:hypothetical protein